MSTETLALKWDIGAASLPQPEELWESEEECPETDTALSEALKSAQKLVTEDLDEDEPSILGSALERAETFLRAQSHQMKKAFGYFAPTPRISPGPNGSVDLHWELASGEMLVNVPAGQAPATYYGESGSTNRTKGSFDPISWHLGIYTWLSKK